EGCHPMKLHSIFRAMCAIVLLALTCATLRGQTYQGGVRGMVRDPGGSVIPAAKVVLTNQSTGTTRSTLTNADGEYVFGSLDPSSYAVSVEAPGFKRMQRNQVVVGTQEVVTVDVNMEMGSVNESVLVTAEGPLLETANASNGQVINAQQLADLPNLG